MLILKFLVSFLCVYLTFGEKLAERDGRIFSFEPREIIQDLKSHYPRPSSGQSYPHGPDPYPYPYPHPHPHPQPHPQPLPIPHPVSATHHHIHYDFPLDDHKEITCPQPYVRAGDMCLYLNCARSGLSSWTDARTYCRNSVRGGDLAVFEDGRDLEEAIQYVNVADGDNDCDYWIGGEDEDGDGVWDWITGDTMQMGTPFWTTDISGNGLAPEVAGTNQYAFLDEFSFYLIADAAMATSDKAPLCQIAPIKSKKSKKKPPKVNRYPASIVTRDDQFIQTLYSHFPLSYGLETLEPTNVMPAVEVSDLNTFKSDKPSTTHKKPDETVSNSETVVTSPPRKRRNRNQKRKDSKKVPPSTDEETKVDLGETLQSRGSNVAKQQFLLKFN